MQRKFEFECIAYRNQYVLSPSIYPFMYPLYNSVYCFISLFIVLCTYAIVIYSIFHVRHSKSVNLEENALIDQQFSFKGKPCSF